MILCFSFVVNAELFSQIGGTSTYQFLNIPTSAREAALGGEIIAANDSDINVIADNPSMLNSSMHNHFALSYINYVSDVNAGYVAYAHYFEKIGTVAGGLHYLNYGKFTEANEYGEKLGEFNAADYSFNLSYARQLHSFFRIGTTLKTIFSQYYNYQSMGMAADVAGTYTSPKKMFIAAVSIKNLGAQIKPYVKGVREKLPLEVQASISQRIAHAPFRLYLVGRQLQKWNLAYQSLNSPPPEVDPITGEVIEKIFTFDKLMRHLIIGAEFFPSKNIYLRGAYNYQRRKEMRLTTKGGLSGFSLGLGIKIYKFNINYALSSYQLGTSSNHITITANLSEFYSKSPKSESP